MSNITIQRGFEDELRVPTARLFWEGFGDKLGFVLGDPTRAMLLLAEAFIPENVFIALDEDHVVGVMALRDIADRECIDITPSLMQKHYGVWSGRLRFWVMGLIFNTQPDQGELWVDSIAVATAARGQGIGSKLLNAAFQFAVENNYQAIGLEVVDNNPRAKALYERLGFEATTEKSIGIFERWVGFASYYRMVKRL